jgi:hypothetical protein
MKDDVLEKEDERDQALVQNQSRVVPRPLTAPIYYFSRQAWDIGVR